MKNHTHEKILLISILLFVAFKSQAQINKPQNSQPQFYLDSVRYEVLPRFDISQIDSMFIAKKDSSAPNGKIFIKSKHPKNLHLLSVSDINTRFSKNALVPTIYMVDNEILKEVSTFRIDSAFILKVEILKGSETDYLNAQFPDLTIFKIVTRTPENISRENEIRIRGIETRHTAEPNVIKLRGVSTASR